MIRPRALTLLVGALALGLGVSILESGCSSDEAKAPESSDASDAHVAQRDAPIEETADAGGPTRATCLASCSDRYPGSKAKDDAIQTCWETKCAGRCTLLDGGEIPDAGEDADAGSCANPVTTNLRSCDLCTVEQCCVEWDSCFSDEACSNYVGCTTRCPVE